MLDMFKEPVKVPPANGNFVESFTATLAAAVKRPFESTVKVGIEEAAPNDPAVIVFAKVKTPAFVNDASPVSATGDAVPPASPTSIFAEANTFEIGVYVNAPVTSPAFKLPPLVTRPFVLTTTFVYVPAPTPVVDKFNTPALEIPASPVIATPVAMPPALPTKIFADVNDEVSLLLNIVKSADAKAPRFVGEAVGILNVCIDPAELIAKSDPPVPTAKDCDAAVNPFNELIALAPAVTCC